MKVAISKLHSYKNNRKITIITACDALFSKMFDEIVDIILVSDSLNMSFFGENNTRDIIPTKKNFKIENSLF